MKTWAATALLAMLFAAPALPGKKDVPDLGRASNDLIDIEAKAIVDKPTIKSELGSDFDGDYTLVQVTVTPKGNKPLPVRLDDFILRTDHDGRRTGPFAPNQIAGSGGLVLHEVEIAKSGPLGDRGGPVWGGMPGTSSQPRQLPGNQGSAGNSGSSAKATDAKVADGKSEKVNPLLAALKAKCMPEANTLKPVAGLLYFPLEKQKLKDLELDYNGPAGQLRIRFH